MSAARYRTALAGFGQSAHGLAAGRRMAAYFPCATHAQALSEHPAFEWAGVLERSPETRARAREILPAGVATDRLEELRDRCAPEVAVLAIPPSGRFEVIESLPSLSAVLVEKPLGWDLSQARAFLYLARERGILVLVNYWRRTDESTRALAPGGMEERIGPVQSVWGVYGNGLPATGRTSSTSCGCSRGKSSPFKQSSGLPRSRRVHSRATRSSPSRCRSPEAARRRSTRSGSSATGKLRRDLGRTRAVRPPTGKPRPPPISGATESRAPRRARGRLRRVSRGGRIRPDEDVRQPRRRARRKRRPLEPGRERGRHRSDHPGRSRVREPWRPSREARRGHRALSLSLVSRRATTVESPLLDSRPFLFFAGTRCCEPRPQRDAR
ncbi:MAG: Gfo/Idh/MocA family oxidoreductase [Planctomycetes bacterium]|nr:Gfo/Idh/MocA family oxidoreductase [Planctomycetota bacterium]